MPSANQVKALISSHADGDEQRFYSIRHASGCTGRTAGSQPLRDSSCAI